MELELLLKLQNGSDIRGIAAEGIPGEIINLTPAVVSEIAGAFVEWLTENYNTPANKVAIAIGRDSRVTGPLLMDAFIQGATRRGANIINCGLASTPAMFMATVLSGMQCDASAMLTASHLPFNRNGLKFFTKDGGLDKEDITRVLQITSGLPAIKVIQEGNVLHSNLLSRYSEHLVTIVRKNVNDRYHYDHPLKGFHILVDAGNGAGGFYAEQVLKPLGADITGSQFLDPDGMFPNHIPNPEDGEAMESLSRAVKLNKADLGLIFDTDVDRAAAVDSDGSVINRNRLIALVSAIVLEEHPGSAIVTDSITSDGLHNFIEQELKGKHHRFKRGYKNVINEALRLNKEGHECWLAIETSGHAAIKENYFMDDGAFLVTKILIKAARLRREGKNLADLTLQLRIPVESKEFRMKISDPDFKTYGNKVINELRDFVISIDGWEIVPDNFEGIRISCGKGVGEGWFLLRLSLHDPVVPLNIESDVEGGINVIASKLEPFFKRFEFLSAFKY